MAELRMFPDCSESPWTQPETGTVFECNDGVWVPQSPSSGGGGSGGGGSGGTADNGMPYVIGTPPGKLMNLRTVKQNGDTQAEHSEPGQFTVFTNGSGASLRTYINLSRRNKDMSYWVPIHDPVASCSVYSAAPDQNGIYQLLLVGYGYQNGNSSTSNNIKFVCGYMDKLSVVTQGEDYLVCINAPHVEYRAA